MTDDLLRYLKVSRPSSDLPPGMTSIDRHRDDVRSSAFRVAGQHARLTTRSYARRALACLGTLAVATCVAAFTLGLRSPGFITVEVVVIAGMLLGNRRFWPVIERWDRGASGEEYVGTVIASLAGDGWLALHDVSLGRGNIDHILIGPAGVFTVETKSHAGPIAVESVDRRMLKQAYAQRKLVERVTGFGVAPLLVFSRAWVDKPGARREGVVILPARMLAGHLARQSARLTRERTCDLHARLIAALS